MRTMGWPDTKESFERGRLNKAGNVFQKDTIAV